MASSTSWCLTIVLVFSCVVYTISQDCKDKDVNCVDWKLKANGCAHTDLMRYYCPKTCDLCRPPSPPIPAVPDCAKTKFGCCWNNITIAKGPVNDLQLSGCPPCLNSQSNTFCNNWKDDCSSMIQGQGDVMRYRCPQTCGVPCGYNLNINNCRDDAANRQNCLQWLQDGGCSKEKAKMRVYCPSTCGFCSTK